MIVFLENPFAIVICTVVLLLIAFYFWVQTRFKWILILMLGLLVFGAGMIYVERMVITDREAIRDTMLEIANVVGENDREGVMQFFDQSSESESTRSRARSQMSQGKIHACRLKKIKKYEFSGNPGDQDCEIVLIASGNASRNGRQFGSAIEFTLQLKEVKKGEWKIMDYSSRLAIPRKRPR